MPAASEPPPSAGPGAGPGPGTGSGPPADAYAPFQARRGPLVATVLGVGVALLCAWLALFVAGPVTWWDRAGFLVVGAPIVWFLHRQATVRADPTPTALTVRNLVHTRTVAWSEVTAVHFGGGRPWVQLDLADGDTLAVMGVQRADGPSATSEASRLATLAAAHGRPPPTSGPTAPPAVPRS